MGWFKVDDHFTDSKPVVNMPDRYRNQAVGAWVLAGAWSARELTDGHIPANVWKRILCGTRAPITDVLCATDGSYVPLLEANPDGSVQITQWDKWQTSAAQTRRERAANAKRKRDNRRKRGVANADQTLKGRMYLSSDDSDLSQCDDDQDNDDGHGVTPPSPEPEPEPEPEPKDVLVVTSGGGVTEGDGADRNGADAPPPPQKISLTDANPVDGSSSGPVCPWHPDGPDHSDPCRVCKAVRVARDQKPPNGLQNDAQREQQRVERDHQDYLRRRAIQRCPDCDYDGRLDWRGRGGIVFTCPHDPTLYRQVHDAAHQLLLERIAAWEERNQRSTNERISHV